MNTAIFAYTRRGCDIALRVERQLTGRGAVKKFTAARLAQPGFSPIPPGGRDFYGSQFAWADVLIFVGSCGIAVREIAPHVRDKRTDPAVIALDERGTFVIPLLSGHMGGANALARELARGLGATPVVTTATDLNGRFSVDTWAVERGLALDSMEMAKAISAAILEGDVPLCTDFPVGSPLPAGLVAGTGGQLGIYVGYETKAPFQRTLRIIPPVLHLGIGCRKGVCAGVIRRAVAHTLEQARIDPRAVRCVASIDRKAEEPGLKEFVRENRWPLRCYPAERLMAVAGDFTPSPFVASVTGADNVCERAAMVGAARLIVKKTVYDGVTVAVAAENWEVSFG